MKSNYTNTTQQFSIRVIRSYSQHSCRVFMFLRKIAVFLITIYQITLSPDTGLLRYCGLAKGGVCGFYPSCSEYTKEAILARGVAVGVFLGAKRVLSCHPYKKQNIE